MKNKIIFLIIMLETLFLIYFYSLNMYNNNYNAKIINSFTNKTDSLNYKINKLSNEISIQNYKYLNLKEFLNDYLENPYIFTRYFRSMNVTGYHPVKEQCDNDPEITADGTKININRAGEHRFVAISRDLLERWGGKVKYNDYILLKGTPNEKYDGIYQVHDTMNSRHKAWIDILLTPGESSFYFKNITMYQINKSDYLKVLKDVYGKMPITELRVASNF